MKKRQWKSSKQPGRCFTNAVSAEELIHIIMGTFRLQKLKWRIGGFKFDLKKDGEKRMQSLLTLIKN